MTEDFEHVTSEPSAALQAETGAPPSVQVTEVWPQVRARLESLQRPFPADAVALAEANREEIAPYLLAALEAVAQDPAAVAADDDHTLHLFAMHLLAGWRDRRAFSPLLALGQFHDAELVDALFGDLLHDSYGRCLASVSGGELAPMMALADDPSASVWIRAAVMDALTDCVVEGEADRAGVVAWLGAAAQREAATLMAMSERLDTPIELLDVIAVSLSNLRAIEWLPAIRQWSDAGLLDPMIVDMETVEENIAAQEDVTWQRLRGERRGYVADAATEMSRWAMFVPEATGVSTGHSGPTWPSWPLATKEGHSSEDLPPRVAIEPVKQIVREHEKVGRNDPCPCGSGRKFKKCHGAA